MKETSKKVLKAAAIASLLTGSVIASTGSIFADKANATPTTASSTAGFTGTIDPSCTVSTGFASTPNAYIETNYVGSGGASKLETSDNAQFNCNSDTVNVSAAVTTTQPTNPTNATAIVGVHTTTLTNENATAQTANGTGATVTATSWRTDTQGNIEIELKSTWDPASGQELLTGTYTANATLTVTPN